MNGRSLEQPMLRYPRIVEFLKSSLPNINVARTLTAELTNIIFLRAIDAEVIERQLPAAKICPDREREIMYGAFIEEQ